MCTSAIITGEQICEGLSLDQATIKFDQLNENTEIL